MGKVFQAILQKIKKKHNKKNGVFGEGMKDGWKTKMNLKKETEENVCGDR